MKNVLFVKLIIIFFVTILVGCSSGQDGKVSRLALLKTTQPAPVKLNKQENRSISEQVKNDVLSHRTIYDAAIIEGEKQILVAYKVNHFYRFKMKGIEKKLKKQLESHFPDQKFVVSSDYKIFLESVRLKEAIKKQSISQKEAKKRFNKIISLTKEMT
ncbi:sporulation protein [Heyndrickxia sp. NPDC080065]|uniref:sporulation protein n=1 Tax=Heyndrickxia sp. NPDC080065 TaxID=3390568 RepID=UPI003D055AA7